MAYIRNKKLTDKNYSPDPPVSEESIREQIDDAIQEVLDAVQGSDEDASGADYMGAGKMDSSDTSDPNTMAKLKWLFARIAWVYEQIQTAILGQIPDESITDAKLSSSGIKNTVASLLLSLGNKLNSSGGQLKNYTEDLVTVTSSGGIATFNLSLGNNFAITLTEDTTFAYTNIPATGVCSFTIFIQQAPVAKTVTHPTSVKYASDISPDISTPSKESIFTYVTKDGGNRIWCQYGTKFAI